MKVKNVLKDWIVGPLAAALWVQVLLNPWLLKLNLLETFLVCLSIFIVVYLFSWSMFTIFLGELLKAWQTTRNTGPTSSTSSSHVPISGATTTLISSGWAAFAVEFSTNVAKTATARNTFWFLATLIAILAEVIKEVIRRW